MRTQIRFSRCGPARAFSAGLENPVAYTTHCKWGAVIRYHRTIDPQGAKNARLDIIRSVSRDIGAGHAGGLGRPSGSCPCKRGSSDSSNALGAPPLGHVCKRLEPEQDHADVDHGEIVLATLFVSSS